MTGLTAVLGGCPPHTQGVPSPPPPAGVPLHRHGHTYVWSLRPGSGNTAAVGTVTQEALSAHLEATTLIVGLGARTEDAPEPSV